MDYYKVLGLSRNAKKEEIKDAFRKLAMEFHPDKHSSSPKSVREGATLRFKQASEAYEVLIDDRKRADYNLRSNYKGTTGFGYGYHNRTNSSSSSSTYYNNTNTHNNSYSYGYRNSRSANGDAFVSKFDMALRFLSTRAFLLNLAFAGILLGGSVIIDMSREALWKMHNPGKSFEEAIESIEKGKAVKNKR